MSKYCLFLIVIYYLTGGNNSMSRFCKFGKLHVTKGNVDKLLGILLTASKELKVPSAYGEFVSIRNRFKNFAVILYNKDKFEWYHKRPFMVPFHFPAFSKCFLSKSSTKIRSFFIVPI